MTQGSPSSPALSQEQTETQSAWGRPRTTDVRASVAKYSRFVSMMKIVLPSVAGLLLATVVILPQFRDEPDQFTTDIVATEGATGDSLSLLNARYFGTDDSGQPFSVTADSVREANGNEDQINLTSPQADISLNDGTWLMVGADEGIYSRDEQRLNLKGAVNLFQDQGYEMHTDAATVLLSEGKAMSTTPVHGQGPFGALESQGFELEDKGKVIHFTGPARLTLKAGPIREVTP